ncbi:unnamed protein product, partial [Rotaria magnacalcarata]
QMIRKPKQRNLRGRTDIDNVEEDHSNVTNPQLVVVNEQSVETKIVVKKVDVPKSLLSFGDDEGNYF